MGSLGPNFLPALFDGSVRIQRSSMPATDLRARITHQGGEDVPFPGTGSGVLSVELTQLGAAAFLTPDAQNDVRPPSAEPTWSSAVTERDQREAGLLAWLLNWTYPSDRSKFIDSLDLQAAREVSRSNLVNAIDEAFRTSEELVPMERWEML
jgi:hypothetical protein